MAMGDNGIALNQKVPLQAGTSLCSQPAYDLNSTALLINDLLSWNFDEKTIGKASSEPTVSSVRLPVFAQFSNPHTTP